MNSIVQYLNSLDQRTIILVVSLLILWVFARPLRWVIVVCLAVWGVGYLIWSNSTAQQFLTTLLS